MPVASKPKITKKSPEEVTEVREFLGAFQRLEMFRQQHADVFAQYDTLVQEYNQKLEDAERTCRAQQIACGPFDLYNFSTKYDAKALYDLIGRERFFKVGGSERSETVYTIDKTKVESAIQRGDIPEDVVDSFKKVSPTFHTPDKITT